MSHFDNPSAISSYAENAARQVPGLLSLHQMMAVLLAEHCGPGAQILVLGAGGGMELLTLAEAQPDWRFVGVDPAAAMLDQARDRLGAFNDRVTLHHGLIDTAPTGPFDGATCLLTLHFLTRADRLATLTALRARLKPGAPFVMAHHSYPQDAAGKALWLGRYAAFAIASGVDAENAQRAAKGLAEMLPTLSPQDEEDLLHQAGFSDVALFYAAFSFRGWVAVNPQ